jgi:hypothetical protein
VPGLPSIPGAPAASDDAFHSLLVALERPVDCFWMAVLGSTLVPAAGPDIVPCSCAMAHALQKASKRGESFNSDLAVIVRAPLIAV